VPISKDPSSDYLEEFSSQGAIDYLVLAGGLARVAAKAAVIYSQWLPSEKLSREADELFEISLQIERNCLEKIKLIENQRHRCHETPNR